ncbi:MAG: enoyl-CoA hydratase-related protein [Ardenticatenales bacterium]
MNSAQSFTHLHVLRDGDVAHVVVDRPGVHNALSDVTIGELTDVFARLGADDGVRFVVLRGEGKHFSAGADLEYMRGIAQQGFEANVAGAYALADMLSAIRDCPKPVVARVQGACMGGGVGLVAACDIAVASVDARFALSEATLGIVPAVISPFVLPRIGVAAARELFLTAEVFDAERARAIGLISRIVEREALDDAVAERIAALRVAGPEAQATVKRLIGAVWDDPAGAREFTAHVIAERRASAEGQEGMSAFLERRKPAWTVADAAVDAAGDAAGGAAGDAS